MQENVNGLGKLQLKTKIQKENRSSRWVDLSREGDIWTRFWWVQVKGRKWEKDDLRQQVLICEIPFQFGVPEILVFKSYTVYSFLWCMARPFSSERSIIFCGWQNTQNFLLYLNGCVLCALLQALISLIENIICNQMNKILLHNLFTSSKVISPFWSTHVHSFCSHLFIHSFMYSLFIHSINMHWAPIMCQHCSSCWGSSIEKLKFLLSSSVHCVEGKPMIKQTNM